MKAPQAKRYPPSRRPPQLCALKLALSGSMAGRLIWRLVEAQ